jgi:hypothetical protein
MIAASRSKDWIKLSRGNNGGAFELPHVHGRRHEEDGACGEWDSTAVVVVAGVSIDDDASEDETLFKSGQGRRTHCCCFSGSCSFCFRCSCCCCCDRNLIFNCSSSVGVALI